VRIGKPMTFEPGTSPEKIAKQLFEAVIAL
jgi:hypothetical protein